MINQELLERFKEDGIELLGLTTYTIPYSKRAKICITEYPENINELWSQKTKKKYKPGYWVRYIGFPAREGFPDKEGLTKEEMIEYVESLLTWKGKENNGGGKI